MSESRSIPVSLVVAGAVTVLAFLAQVWARETIAPGAPWRLALTGVLVLSFAATIWVHVRLTATLDEFMRQVQYTALSFAFPVSLVVAFAIGYFAGEGVFAAADPRDLPLVMILAYAASFVWAWRRYR